MSVLHTVLDKSNRLQQQLHSVIECLIRLLEKKSLESNRHFSDYFRFSKQQFFRRFGKGSFTLSAIGLQLPNYNLLVLLIR